MSKFTDVEMFADVQLEEPGLLVLGLGKAVVLGR